MRTKLRRWLRRFHLWLAVAAGLFFVVLGFTGSLLAFSDSIDQALHAGLYDVPARSGVLPLPQLLASVRRSFPRDDVVAVTMSPSPREAWQVALPSGIAFVDPHTGRVAGLRNRGMAFVGILRQIHVSLACGSIGRTAVRWTDVAALLLLLSGIQLWWPLRKFGIRGKAGDRRFWIDLHNSLGVVSFVFLLVAVTTGALLSFEGSVDRLLDRLQSPRPAEAVVLPVRNGPYLSPDQALARAQQARPGEFPRHIQMPAYGGTYRITMERGHTFGTGEDDVLTLDPYTGAILRDDSSRNRSPAWHLLTTAAALHTGAWFGMAGRVTMAAASLFVVLQAFSGAMMLWRRKRPHPLGESL